MDDKYITLGCCSSFLLTMLGDFCSKNGLNSKSQKDYKDELTKSAFGKYHQSSKDSKLAQIKNDFYITLLKEYKCIINLPAYLLTFPSFLQDSIKYLDCRIPNYLDRKQLIIFLVINYLTFFYRCSNDKSRKNFIDTIGVHATNSYKDLLQDMKISNNGISENANWSTVEKLLQEANNDNCYENENERLIDCMFLADHYIYLGFKKALKECFNFSDDELKKLESVFLNDIQPLVEYQEFYLNSQEAKETAEIFELKSNSPEILYSLLNVNNPDNCYLLNFFYNPDELMSKRVENDLKHFKECFNPKVKDEVNRYFVNSYSRITEEKASGYINQLKEFNDEYYEKIMIPFYEARLLIFSLTFTDKEKDQKLKKEACNIYKNIFDNYKYEIGPNLQEFLSDAIACDVYCNPKKDIFNNSQDNTSESSIESQGKAYWEFGFALGIFPENSKKTYLLTFNVEENFWKNFPPSKFINQKKALETFYRETRNSEYELPVLLENFNDKEKLENLENFDRQDTRQPLGHRYYSNFSIRCLKLKDYEKNKLGNSDFTLVRNFINNHSNQSGKLFICDENGANGLLRTLDRYKMLSYGFSDQAIVERARLLQEFHEEYYQKFYEVIIKEFPDCGFTELVKQGKLNDYYESCINTNEKKLLDFYDCVSNKRNDHCTETNKLMEELKSNIILPLINCGGPKLLDEAIFLNGRYCVSALQLAIDCYDYEIVKSIVENLPENINLSELLISNEYVTPLQYAIRKYDYVMQFTESLCNNNKLNMLEKRTIINKKNTGHGILKYDQDYYSKRDYIPNTFIASVPAEECGLFLTNYKDGNICSLQQKNLIEIIKLLAEKTDPISVSTFYYLADQVDPKDGQMFNDVLDLVRILINTEHADLSGTDFEWDTPTYIPNQTLIAYCINHSTKTQNNDKSISQKNYGLLNLLLTEYPDKFEKIINEKIQGLDNDGNYRCDTDLHFFITNMIESIKVYSSDPKKNEDYGKILSYRLNHFLELFKKAGAKFDIPDNNNKTALDYLKTWKDSMPPNSIPEDILKMM